MGDTGKTFHLLFNAKGGTIGTVTTGVGWLTSGFGAFGIKASNPLFIFSKIMFSATIGNGVISDGWVGGVGTTNNEGGGNDPPVDLATVVLAAGGLQVVVTLQSKQSKFKIAVFPLAPTASPVNKPDEVLILTAEKSIQPFDELHAVPDKLPFPSFFTPP
jgi:hypothetical protein